MLKIITTRRVAQTFFFALFLWFCVVATLGESWWQLRGWPVNWFLQLDPLVGLGVLLATHTLYAGLLWGVVTLVLTLILGRFFCGWICPMGALQQFVGYLGSRKLKIHHRIERNQAHPAQRLKYWLLFFLLSAAAVDLIGYCFHAIMDNRFIFVATALLLLLFLWVLRTRRMMRIKTGTVVWIGAVLILAGVWKIWFSQYQWLSAALHTGLLDPIPFIYRSVNLVLLPIADGPVHLSSAIPRLYAGSGLVAILFLAVILLCLRVPRFYCRFICPLGALLGLLSRWALWRIGKGEDRCKECRICEADCEGACAPSGSIRIAECVLCLNCMDQCRHGLMGYHLQPSAAGEVPGPDLNRRHVMSAAVVGLLAVPALRMDGELDANWNPQLIRPPGALGERDFLSRCIKCGQCMRICPTNVIHAAEWRHGVENLWTPVLNFRIGTSGCQHNCVACSHICPTAALRPITVDERMGRKAFSENGPLRTGMAFVDRGRCLPWAMDTPCIVCQENCPVSPKAIFTRVEYRPVRNGTVKVQSAGADGITVGGARLIPDRLAGGDFFIDWDDHPPVPIESNTAQTIGLGAGSNPPAMPAADREIRITVRLQKPFVDPARCIGCGVCEHECPVQGRRAIRITAENETRHPHRKMIIG